MAPSYLEASFLAMCRHYGLPLPEQQYRFAPPRRWAFDFAWVDHQFAVEIDGAGPGGMGRHQRPAGYEKDCEKFESAMLRGWTVYRVPGKWIATTQRHIWRQETITAIGIMLGDREHLTGGRSA